MRLFLPLITILILGACANPAKLLEAGKYAQALKVSSRQLQNGRVKAAELAALENAFYLLTQADSQQIDELKATGHPDIWPKIYDLALEIRDRQTKLETLKNHLAESGYFPELNFFPAAALVTEAAQKSALYHYASAQGHLPLARNGNRPAARRAYEQLSLSLSYVDNFKDAAALQLEMRDLGTTHLLLNPGYDPYGRYYTEPGLLRTLYWGHHFPEQQDWLVIHADPATAPDGYLELGFYFDDLSVSSDREVISSCTNSVEVEDGFKIKKVWSEKDSAYVEVKEIIYKTVTATVETIEQVKEADVSLQMILYDPRSGEAYLEDRVYGSEDWSNLFSRTSGDDRAIGGSCSGPAGMWCSFPSDASLLDDAVDDMRMSFWRRVSAAVEF